MKKNVTVSDLWNKISLQSRLSKLEKRQVIRAFGDTIVRYHEMIAQISEKLQSGQKTSR